MQTSAPTGRTARGPVGPTARADRSAAPDLARGGVLLGIALANVSLYLYGTDVGPGGRPVDGSTLDRGLDLVVTLLVNDRSRPMFGLLFGFGLVTMARRMRERGLDGRARTAVLVRRNLWLIAFGAVHAALLFEGDILGIYGVTGLLVLLLMDRGPRVRLAWGALSLVGLALVYGLAPFLVEVPSVPTSYPASVLERLPLFGLGLFAALFLLLMLAPMLLGVSMARAGLLDRPWEHTALLRRIAVAGIATGLVGGLPYALLVAGVVDVGAPAEALLGVVHALSGVAMGAAYVCLFALWAARSRTRAARGATTAAGPVSTAVARGPVSSALAAVGERSLTCYLLQSLLLAPLLAPWGFGVGEQLGTAAAYGIAVLVWLVGVALAWTLAATGHRGPFEVLLRRLTYGRPDRRGALVPPSQAVIGG